jgi:hypothetical protein
MVKLQLLIHTFHKVYVHLNAYRIYVKLCHLKSYFCYLLNVNPTRLHVSCNESKREMVDIKSNNRELNTVISLKRTRVQNITRSLLTFHLCKFRDILQKLNLKVIDLRTTFQIRHNVHHNIIPGVCGG